MHRRWLKKRQIYSPAVILWDMNAYLSCWNRKRIKDKSQETSCISLYTIIKFPCQIWFENSSLLWQPIEIPGMLNVSRQVKATSCCLWGQHSPALGINIPLQSAQTCRERGRIWVHSTWERAASCCPCTRHVSPQMAEQNLQWSMYACWKAKNQPSIPL